MREIGRVSAGGAARAGAGRRPGPAGGFTVGRRRGPAAAAAGAAAGAAAPVGLGLLALQEGGDRAARDQAARRRGRIDPARVAGAAARPAA